MASKSCSAQKYIRHIGERVSHQVSLVLQDLSKLTSFVYVTEQVTYMTTMTLRFTLFPTPFNTERSHKYDISKKNCYL